MGEAWDKHIQPILNSWHRWDNYSWVSEPFLEFYPELDDLKRSTVEDALVESVFDTDHKIAVKALSIIEMLYRQKLSTKRLVELITERLRNQLGLMRFDDDISSDYILAFSTFELTESIPVIKSILVELKKMIDSPKLEGRNDKIWRIVWAGYLSLSRFNPEESKPFLPLLLETDRITGFVTPSSGYLTWRVIVNLWEYVGINGLEAVLQKAQGWTMKERLQVRLLLTDALQKNHKISLADKNIAQKMIAEL